MHEKYLIKQNFQHPAPTITYQSGTTVVRLNFRIASLHHVVALISMFGLTATPIDRVHPRCGGCGVVWAAPATVQMTVRTTATTATRLQHLASLGLHSHWAMNSADPPHAQRTRQLVFPFLSKLMYLSQTKTSQSITLHKIEHFYVRGMREVVHLKLRIS